MQLTERDDIIFTRNIAGAVDESRLIGNTPGNVDGLYWASDHVGVWAELDIP